MILNITQCLIDRPGCPIARAMDEQTPYGAHVGCDTLTIWGLDWDVPRTIRITYARALDFIKRRDAGKSVRPFQFSIDLS